MTFKSGGELPPQPSYLVQDPQHAPLTETAAKLPPQPLGTFFLDKLRFLLPNTWYGLAYNVELSPLVPSIDWSHLWNGILGLLLPLLTIISVQSLLTLQGHSLQQQPRLLLPLYLTSPWTIQSYFATTTPLRQLVSTVQQQYSYRTEPLEDAVETLQHMVEQRRAFRHRRYDLYLPKPISEITTTATTSPSQSPSSQPSPSFQRRKIPIQSTHKHHRRIRQLNSQSESLPEAIILFPGAGVSHASYAAVASMLADAGYIVVVPSVEPMRLALWPLGANWQSLKRIMTRVQQQLGTNCRWIIGGHSMGSFAAMKLAHALHTSDNKQYICKGSEQFILSNRLIMWATMYLPTYATPLDGSNIQLLLLQGDHDSLLDLTQTERDEFLAEYVPKGCRETFLKGGTHAGFASYSSTFVEPGKSRVLSREAQQELACRKTIQFLKTAATYSRTQA